MTTRHRRRPATDIALIATFAALIVAASVLAIPIGPVPVTLQTFAVLLAGAVLGASRGFLAVVLYLALGAIGLPVFAGGSAGLAPFAGPTVGYLIGMPLAALATGFIVERLPRRSAVVNTVLVFLAALVSNVVLVYGLGILGLAWRAELDLGAAFMINLAFVPMDLAKIVLAAIVATAVHRAFPDLLPRRGSRHGQAGRAEAGSRAETAVVGAPAGTPAADVPAAAAAEPVPADVTPERTASDAVPPAQA